MSPRVRLEDRRQGWVVRCTYRETIGANNFEMRLYVGVGFDRRTLQVGEVFLNTGLAQGKDSLLERTIQDIAPLISRLLQHGETAESLTKAIGRTGGEATIEIPQPANGPEGPFFREETMPVSSPIAAVLAVAETVQKDLDALDEKTRLELRGLDPKQFRSQGGKE